MDDATGDWAPGLQKAKTYEQILLDIILGVLPPGGLIDERKLAARYDVGLAGVRERAEPGETLRYRCDRQHAIRVVGDEPVHATMVCFMKAALME